MVILGGRQTRKQNSLYLSLAVACIAVIAVIASAAAQSPQSISKGDLKVNFIDVGQGDSTLIQLAEKNILVDGGEADMGSRVVSYLKDHNIDKLNLVVATHPHSDHIGGLITVLNDFEVKRILDNVQPHSSQTYENFLTLIDQKNIPYSVAERGQTIDFDPAIKIEVLSPPASRFDDINENSIVLKVTYNKISFLLMGDAGLNAENSLLSSGYNLKADILKVGHHGSSHSSSQAFLNKVLPSISIIEVGANNEYGHPAQQTLNALNQVGSKIYRTDVNGNIVVTTDGTKYSVTTQRSSTDGSSTITATPKSTASSSTIAPLGMYSSGAKSYVSQPVTTTTISQETFVGSKKSNKYHYPNCAAAQKIKPENIITFSSSQDAMNHGYVPCGICHPP